MLDSRQQFKLRKLINELKKIRGRHTELVTVYIPAGYDLNKIIQHLIQEQGTAANIKDKTNKRNVQDSLDKMIRHLKLYNRTPENGLAVFCGNTSEQEGKQDLKVWSVEPPNPLSTRMYRCDQTFVLQPLEEMIVTRETYGLIVLDNREATVGLLKGKSLIVLKEFTSSVPGKIKVGGWCLDPETLICKSDGEIVRIGNLQENSQLKSFDVNGALITDSLVLGRSITKHSQILEIITGAPMLRIKSSLNHTFFVVKGNKIKWVLASELKVGDFLLTPENVQVWGETQYLNYSGDGSTKLPSLLTEDLARLVGYAIGDGSYDKENRLELAEGRESVARYYSELIYTLFGKRSTFRFRRDKNYWEVRINSRNVVRFLKSQFPEKKYCETSLVPINIMKSKNEVVASFLRGLFDAEGFSDKDEVAITMKNKQLVNQVHLLLLRFGVVCSFCYAGRGKWSVRITDKESLVNFRNHVGFYAIDKAMKLDKLIEIRSYNSHTRQIVYSGRTIRNILETFGYIKQDFKSASMFLCDRRGMSKNVFFNTFLHKLTYEPELYSELKRISDYPLIPTKVTKIELIKGDFELIDIGVKNKNFFANGILVHNSQMRYSRLREEAANEFYKRVADLVNTEFLTLGNDLKGILVGGPGPTKEKFVHKDHLNNELKKKIVAIKDITYTDASGLHELLDRSHEEMHDAELIKEKKLVEEFLGLIAKDSDKAIYGVNDVKKALEYGAVAKLLVSESFPYLEDFEEKAMNSSSEVFIISEETKEGVQLKELGGVAAILRYGIKNL